MVIRLQSENDIVYTNSDFAKRIINYFNPKGFCFDPCRGAFTDESGKNGGSFYDHLPQPKDWADIQLGRDCVDYPGPVDWIITNPPWSGKAYRKVARHSFSISMNVVFLIRLDLAIGTYARLNDA